jgi:hypothetical protein
VENFLSILFFSWSAFTLLKKKHSEDLLLVTVVARQLQYLQYSSQYIDMHFNGQFHVNFGPQFFFSSINPNKGPEKAFSPMVSFAPRIENEIYMTPRKFQIVIVDSYVHIKEIFKKNIS